MMKLKHPIAVLACLLSIQISNAKLTFNFSHELGSGSGTADATIQKMASEFWFSEEQSWKVLPKDQDLSVEYSLISAKHVARTHGNKIVLNKYTLPEDREFVIKHEVSHIFLSSYCPKVTDPFIHELFAYWRSGDYQRLLYGQKQIYMKSEAIKLIQSNGTFDSAKAIATVRLINELVNKEKSVILTSWFRDIFKNCNNVDFSGKPLLLQNQFIASIQQTDAIQGAVGETGFVLFDSVANEIIEFDGNWKKRQSVGSILKPFLISFFQDVKNSKTKKNTLEWNCGDKNKNHVKWNYKKALNHSCNGFFLESTYPSEEIENYLRVLNSITGLTYSAKWLNAADLIGLWPGIKMNLLDVAKIYDYIVERDPQTIRVLKQTSISGTLSDLPESKWFSQNGVALKSGTTTRLDLSVEAGYLVAIFNIESAPKIAVFYKSGTRPAELIPELKNRLVKYLNFKDSKAQVQVLSSFNQKILNITCPTLVLKNDQMVSSNILALSDKSIYTTRFSCIGAAFEVTGQDKTLRRLYGDLSFQKVRGLAINSAGRSEKNIRTQIGSQIILNTTESHYMKSVFFSESLNHRLELKKALLLVIKNNLGYWKNKNKPICDTTICQVFNLNYEQVTDSQKKWLTQLILDLGNKNLGSQKWLEFSLGGQKEWEQTISKLSIAEFLRTSLKAELSGKKINDTFSFIVDDKEIYRHPCENVRGYFKLKSCPSSLDKKENEEYIFRGRGEGHQRGMELTEANQMAMQGFNFDQIIENYYGIKVLSTRANRLIDP